MLSNAIGRIEFRAHCAQFKGKLANEIKDPILRLVVQATRCAELYQEKQMNTPDDADLTHNPWGCDEDRKEFARLDSLRKFITKEAAGGDPALVAKQAAWELATSGSANLKEVRAMYNGALRHATKAIKAAEKAE